MTIHILIVDDEPDIRSMLSRHLRFSGYSVDEAENGRDALEKMAKRKTDIVITDIMMPVMDGVDLLRNIQKHYPLTRRIVITGYVTLENALSCLRQGADTFILKPLEDLGELDEAVERSVRTVAHWVELLKKLSGMKTKK